MNQLAKRTTGSIVVLALAALGVAAPCAADPVVKPAAASSLSALSPASLEILRAAPAAPRTQETQGAPAPGFFKSRRGALALGLVAAGVGFTIWSIHDSRKPVRSPVR